MNYRVMKKDEFVARMLADQELRRRSRKPAYRPPNVLYCYIHERDERITHKQHIKRKQGGSWG